MGITDITIETLYEDYLLAARYLEDNKSSLSDDLRIAINAQIVLGATCYLEGYFEYLARKILFEFHRMRTELTIEYPDNETRVRLIGFYNRLEALLEDQIPKTIGFERYQNLFEILTGAKFSQDKEVRGYVEPISILFGLRNLMAHGRLLKKEVIVSAAPMPPEDETVSFSVGYRRVENFLRKNNLLETNTRKELSLKDFLSDKAVGYFLNTAEEFGKSIPGFLRRAYYVMSMEEFIEEILKEDRDEINKEKGTCFTGFELVKMGLLDFPR